MPGLPTAFTSLRLPRGIVISDRDLFSQQKN
jgi:hypothetical protein